MLVKLHREDHITLIEGTKMSLSVGSEYLQTIKVTATLSEEDLLHIENLVSVAYYAGKRHAKEAIRDALGVVK